MPDGIDDFDSFVTPAKPKQQREFRTDRNNNPIAAAVTTGGRNQFTDALDKAEIPWEHGDQFPGNPKLSTIKIKGDPFEGARAILSNSNALKWYRSSTGKTILPKYNVRSAADFTKLPIDHQNDIINGIYQSEGGRGGLKPSQDDFDKYVGNQQPTQQAVPQLPAPTDDFDKFVSTTPQSPAPLKPSVTSMVKAVDDEPSAAPLAKPLDFKQGATAPVNPTLNPVGAAYNELSKPDNSVRGIAGLQSRKYQTPESRQLGDRVFLPLSSHVTPSESEVVNGYLSTLGPDYVKAGEQYKAQTGHDILTLGGGALKQDEQGRYYVRPSKGAVDFINTYVQSGGDLNKAMGEAQRQVDEHLAAENKAVTDAAPDVKEAKGAERTAKDSPVLRGMIGSMVGPAQAFGSVLPGSAGDEFQRQAAVEKAATEQVNKDAPLTTTGERIKAGIGGLIPTAAMLIATHKLGPAQLAALGALEGSTPQERIRGGLQGAAAQAVLGGAPAAFDEAGLPITGKATTGAAMVAQPAVEAMQRGESPTQAITENLPFAALPFLSKGGGAEKPTELAIDRASTDPTVKPSEPVRHVDLQTRDEVGKFDKETPAQAEARRAQVEQASRQPYSDARIEPDGMLGNKFKAVTPYNDAPGASERGGFKTREAAQRHLDELRARSPVQPEIASESTPIEQAPQPFAMSPEVAAKYQPESQPAPLSTDTAAQYLRQKSPDISLETPAEKAASGNRITRQMAKDMADVTPEDEAAMREWMGEQPANEPPAQPSPEAVAQPSTSPSDTTGIKHAVVEAERELQGLPQFIKARRSHGESFDQGVAAVQNNEIDPRALATALVKDPRPLSTKESMALLYDRMRISSAKEQAAEALQVADKSGDVEKIASAAEKVKQLEAASDANDEAVYRAGSEQGRGLAIRRELINRDYSRAVVTAKLRAQNKGRELPADIKEHVDDLTSRLEVANKRIDNLEAAAGEKQSLAKTDKFIREYKVRVRGQSRQRSREQLAAERADIKQQIAAEFRAQKPKSSTLSMGGLGDIDPEGKLTRLVGDLARNYIEDGVTKANDLVDAVHGHIKDVVDVTKREVGDLISGYGRIRQSVSDPVEKKLNELKSILAANSGKADVLERGIRAARRGQQREKPTEDQRRALRELQDAMKEKGPQLARRAYDAETEQATPLDKAKTTTRNRIEQLKGWIASGKREVQGRQQVIPDGELRQLKTEQGALEKVAALIADPAADQKAIERRLTELNKAVADSKSAIKSGRVTPEGIKEGAQSLWTPEIGATEKERATLRQIITDMRTGAAQRAAKAKIANEQPANFYGATDSWEGYEREARKTLAVQKAQEQVWQRKVADLQKELADTKRTERRQVKAERKSTPETAEVKVAKRNAQVLQSQIDNLGNVIDWRNKNVAQKALSYAAAGTRAGILTGTKTIGKIGSALGQSAAQQYMGEVAGEGARKLFPRTSALAPRHGQRLSGASEGEFARGVGQGIKDIPRAIKSGETSLTLEAGKRYPSIPTKAGIALSVPGRIHMAEKNIIGSGEFSRAKEMNLNWAERQKPGASKDPDVQQWAKDAAMKHAEEIMMLGDNPFSRFVRYGRRALTKEGNDISRIAVPVERVPSNYLFSHLIGEFGLGLPRGLVRGARSEIQLRSALRKAVADTSAHYMDGTLSEAAKELERRNPDLMGRLTPEEADKTLRLLKRGTVGLMYMTLGALGGAGTGKAALGGYYGGAGDKQDVKPMDVKIGPVTIPHYLLHSAPNELAQFTSTVKREIQSQVANNKMVSGSSRAKTGVVTGIKGVAQQVPFLNEYVDAVKSLKDGDSASIQAGKWLAARIEPQIMQELAKATDRESSDTARRKPEGFTDALKLGVPGLRQSVPINEKAKVASEKAAVLEDVRSGQSPDLDSLVDSGRITKADKKAIESDAKLTPRQLTFSNAFPDKALDRYERMNAAQRAEVEDLMSKKAWNLIHSDSLTEAQKAAFKERIDALGITPVDGRKKAGSSPSSFKSRFMSATP